MAVAAGMMQVAAIKKQQQASQAQGYAEGGFTRPGRVDEVAGVVHAGEWVASQRLLASPVVRPLIEALDYAQRTNTIGSLRQTDVSRTITAPAVLAQSQAPTVIVQENKALRDTLARLNERLNEPFVTVNTVTGDLGIKQAQDDYQRLMNNKSPKKQAQVTLPAWAKSLKTSIFFRRFRDFVSKFHVPLQLKTNISYAAERSHISQHCQ